VEELSIVYHIVDFMAFVMARMKPLKMKKLPKTRNKSCAQCEVSSMLIIRV